MERVRGESAASAPSTNSCGIRLRCLMPRTNRRLAQLHCDGVVLPNRGREGAGAVVAPVLRSL